MPRGERCSQSLSKTKSQPSETVVIWRGEAAERVSFRACAEAKDAQLASPTATAADTAAELGCGMTAACVLWPSGVGLWRWGYPVPPGTEAGLRQ